jgi:HTH-type transcriptional regulator / antitoxin HigA
MPTEMRRRRSTTTDVKPIRNAADHRAAMAEVKRLWGSKKGTADGDHLDRLATPIDAYESQHEPIDRSDPAAPHGPIPAPSK